MLCTLFRWIFGWNDSFINMPSEDTVVVFTHTSYWDAFILLLYKDKANLLAIAKPQLFTWASTSFLRYLGFIKAPKLESRGSGGVLYITNQIQESKSKTTIILISPKGTIQKHPWRSGYKYIAKELQWPICAAMIDYEKRIISFSDKLTEETELKNYCDLGCPLRPTQSEFIGPYDPFELLSCVDLVCASNLAMFLPIFKAITLGYTGTAIVGLINFFLSMRYHRSKETCGLHEDAIGAKVSILLTLYYYGSTASLEAYGYALGASFAYVMGTPRLTGPRGHYVIWHSIFHVLLSISLYMAII